MVFHDIIWHLDCYWNKKQDKHGRDNKRLSSAPP